LALGHYANHPPKGKQPNVLIAAYDYPIGLSGEQVATHSCKLGERRMDEMIVPSGSSLLERCRDILVWQSDVTGIQMKADTLGLDCLQR